ncbi:MAG: hypothetical protein NVS2B6_08370 [Thermoleophilaceae bacterium]
MDDYEEEADPRAGADGAAPAPDRDPHHALNSPVGEPDPTEWPDPFEHRPDPRAPRDDVGGGDPHTPTGSTSTSEPHPHADPEATKSGPPERDHLDD